jgi:hypothetical protein
VVFVGEEEDGERSAQQSLSPIVRVRSERRGSVGLWKGKTEVLRAWKTGGGVLGGVRSDEVVESRARVDGRTAEGARRREEREIRRNTAGNRCRPIVSADRMVRLVVGVF